MELSREKKEKQGVRQGKDRKWELRRREGKKPIKKKSFPLPKAKMSKGIGQRDGRPHKEKKK